MNINTGWKVTLWIVFSLAICVILAGSHWAMYQQGKVKGYAQASKDRATQTYQATTQAVTNTYVYTPRKAFSLLSLGSWSLLSKDKAEAVPVVTQ